MYAKSALLAALSAAAASAMPGHPGGWGNGWGNSTGSANAQPESQCATTYSTSYYTVETVIPHVNSRTTWVPTVTTTNSVVMQTSLIQAQNVNTKESTTCYTSSYPVTTVYWVTTLVEDVIEVFETETCMETTSWQVNVPVTIQTAAPSVEVCTEYETACSTVSTVIAQTTCTPCAEGAGANAAPTGKGW